MNQLPEWVTVLLPTLTITLGFGIFIYIGISNLGDTKPMWLMAPALTIYLWGTLLFGMAYTITDFYLLFSIILLASEIGLIIAYIIYEIITKDEEVF